MAKRNDDGKYISWYDAMELWRAVERSYRVKLEILSRQFIGAGGSLHLSNQMEAYSGEAGQTGALLATVGFPYPNRDYASYTGALVATLHRMGVELDKRLAIDDSGAQAAFFVGE